MIQCPALIPEIDALSLSSKNEATQEAVTMAMQEARATMEDQTIAVCQDCPRDWKGYSCFMCDTITVTPSGKVIFEGIH